MEFTKAQKDAIYKRGGEILVSAAAGSGKTAVLTERVLQFVLQGGSLDRLLIVTFTVKAVAQMRERISTAINEKLAENADNIHLLRQSMIIHKAKICTIDKLFCEIVRSNFYSLDISSNFKIADATEIILLEQMIASNIVDECYETTENFDLVCDLVCEEKTDDKVVELIIKFSRFLSNIPFEELWLTRATGDYEATDLSHNTWTSYIFENLIDMLGDLLISYNDEMQRLKDFEEVAVKFIPLMQYEKDCIIKLQDLCASKSWDEIKLLLSTIGIVKSPTVPKDYTNHFEKLNAMKVRVVFKELISKLSTKIFDVSVYDMENDKNHLKPILKTIIDIVLKFKTEYNNTLKMKNILSFSDISKLALRLLVELNDDGTAVPTSLAKEMAALYDEVLIDEYQDTNDIQELIFSALSCNNEKLFVVGDIRQSIYRFRNACPEIFKNKQQIATSSTSDFPALVNLSDNFRSRQEIISFINFFFGACMSQRVGDIDYSNKQFLTASAPYPKDASKSTEITILKSKARNSPNESDTSTLQNEARYIATKIVQMLKDGYEIFDIKQNCYRKAIPSDFVILLRDLKSAGNIFANELEKAGVPVYSETTTSYFESYEIMAVISILATINNPYDDISLAATLRCPCFGFTNDDLIDIRVDATNLCFYDALKLKAKDNKKYSDILETIDFLRIRSRELPIYRFLMLIINELSLMRIFGSMDRGESRQNNLNQICRYAKTYEDSGTRGLYGFINFINKVIEENASLCPINSMPSNSFVSILTIHKSKGLEFPIVFLSLLGKRINDKALQNKFMLDKELGIGCIIRNMEMEIEFSTTAHQANLLKEKTKQISEEMRILYVASTRAMDKFFITLSNDNLEKTVSEASCFTTKNGRISPVFLTNSNSLSKWVIGALTLCDDIKNDLFYGESSTELISKKSGIKVNIIPTISDDISTNELEETVVENAPKVDENLKQEIYSRLLFKYKKEGLNKISSKLTVSEIKSKLLDDNSKMLYDDLSFIKPNFLNENNGAKIGTAIHKILQYADIEKCRDITYLKETLAKIYENGIISKTIYNHIKITSLLAFFNSNLASRMINATELFKEYRFTVMLPIKQYYNITKEPIKTRDETILLQGVIDCFFIENGKITLIDYKTDYFENENELVEKYEMQLKLYKKALEIVFNIEVSEKIIYSFFKDKEIVL